MFIALALSTLINNADLSGIWQSPDGRSVVVITKQEWGWRTEWWFGVHKHPVPGSIRRMGWFNYEEWCRPQDSILSTYDWLYSPFTDQLKSRYEDHYRRIQ